MNKKIIAINFTFFLFIFFSIFFIQQRSNVLPFFLSHYPTYEVNGRPNFDSSSESLVLNRIDFETFHLDYPSKFQLWRVDNDRRAFGDFNSPNWVAPDYKARVNSRYLIDGEPYTSQIGYQSLAWAKISKAFQLDRGNYAPLHILHIAILSAIFTIILMWIRSRFGTSKSLISAFFVCASTGLAVFSMSLYWTIALFFMPMCISALYANSRSIPFFVILPALFLTFFLKFTAGYEFISVIVILAVLPIIVDIPRIGMKICVARSFAIFSISLLAFTASLVLYNHLFVFDFGVSGFNQIASRSSSWMAFLSGNNSMNYWVGQVAKILMVSIISFDKFGIPIGVFLPLYVLMVFSFWKKMPVDERLLTIGTVAASSSWFILQLGHLLFHPRYASLVTFPLLLSFAICLVPRVGLALRTWAFELRELQHKDLGCYAHRWFVERTSALLQRI